MLAHLVFGVRLVAALVARPGLIPTAVRQAVALVPTRWWTRPCRLPIPPRDYVEFRQVTAAGHFDGPPTVSDTIVWLTWCRAMRGIRRTRVASTH